MSEEQSPIDEFAPEGGRRRKQRSRLPGCLAVLVALVLVIGGFYFAVTKGVGFVRDQFADPADYEGPGRGRVTFEVESGDSVAEMGRGLKEAGVVASVQAFLNAAAAEPGASAIQVGFYQFKKEMAAADAVDVLLDPDNILKDTITIPEGLRVVDIVELLTKNSDFSKQQFQTVLDNPEKLGLPDYAEGNPEGYLFPSTYDFGPDATPTSMLVAMVDRWEQAAAEADLEGAAAALGYTPHELMTVASLVEAEASRQEDRGKVARVIYNRIENPGTAGTVGLLQIDATINFAIGRDLGFAISPEDREFDSPYNTYVSEGLPPGPIEAPGDAAIAAAAHPTEGDWYYYVTVNLRTGETKFAETYDEFLTYDNEFEAYCDTSDAC
jgi:UPF0755 protein